MADDENYGLIAKGMKLTIFVEEVINDVIVVVLKHRSRVFRGILLDAKKRNIPAGIFKGSAGEDGQSGTNVNTEDRLANQQDEIPATVFRHTYFQNTTQFGANVTLLHNHTFPKLGHGNRTRNIRLRPRQTLCNKCKSVCLESQAGPIPVKSPQVVMQKEHGNRQHNSLPHSQSENDLSKFKHGKRRSNVQNDRNSEKEFKPIPTKLIKVTRDKAKLTKTSPFIKISIGDTNVMNIPPRIHESDKDESETEKFTDNEENSWNIETERTYVDKKTVKQSNHYKRILRPSVDDRSDSDNGRGNNSRKSKKVEPVHGFDENDGDLPPNIIITENIDSEENDDMCNSEQKLIEPVMPELAYAVLQNNDLSSNHESHLTYIKIDEQSHSSEICPSPFENLDGTSCHEHSECLQTTKKNVTQKEYKRHSRSKSIESNSEFEVTQDSVYISYEDPKSVSNRSEECSTEIDTTSDTDDSDYGEGPPGDEDIPVDAFKPLLMKIHTNSVSKCVTPDGRKIHMDDIVWGKVKGFPWWPGRVITISVSQKDNGIMIRQTAQVAWFGSKTVSHIQCSDLYPFLDDYKVRYNRKKRSTPYRKAIKLATIAAKGCNSHDIDFKQYDLT